VRRFGICLLVALAASLVPPVPEGRSRTDLFGLAADFVAVLLVALALYAAALVVMRIRRSRRMVKAGR